MDTRLLSENMLRIVDMLSSLKPYEVLSVQADAQGRPDSFIVSRSNKVLLVVNKDPEFKSAKPKLAGD